MKAQDPQSKFTIPTQEVIPQRTTQTPNPLLKSAVVKVGNS